MLAGEALVPSRITTDFRANIKKRKRSRTKEVQWEEGDLKEKRSYVLQVLRIPARREASEGKAHCCRPLCGL